MDYFHTGKYNLKTDAFEGGELGAFAPIPEKTRTGAITLGRIVYAKTAHELAEKVEQRVKQYEGTGQ